MSPTRASTSRVRAIRTRSRSPTLGPTYTPGSPAPTSTPGVPGDVNGDGRIDADDIPPLIGALFSDVPPPSADVNADETVSAADLVALLRLLGGGR